MFHFIQSQAGQKIVPEKKRKILISDKMTKKHKTVRELNLEVEFLSERIRKLEEKDDTINLDEDTKLNLNWGNLSTQKGIHLNVKNVVKKWKTRRF